MALGLPSVKLLPQRCTLHLSYSLVGFNLPSSHFLKAQSGPESGPGAGSRKMKSKTQYQPRADC